MNTVRAAIESQIERKKEIDAQAAARKRSHEEQRAKIFKEEFTPCAKALDFQIVSAVEQGNWSYEVWWSNRLRLYEYEKTISDRSARKQFARMRERLTLSMYDSKAELKAFAELVEEWYGGLIKVAGTSNQVVVWWGDKEP